MKLVQSLMAVATVACVLPAQAATNDPEIIIYRAAGVMDDGGVTGAGVATVFQCTNVSAVAENIRFVVRNSTSFIVANLVFTVGQLQTRTVTTHLTSTYGGSVLNPGVIIDGTAAIAATSPNVLCTAKTVDAAPVVPSGIVLPMVRFNAIAGTQE